MKWDNSAEALYRRIVERVPAPQRAFVEVPLRRAAEAVGARNATRTVAEGDVIAGFFECTPEPFYAQVIANLSSLGIDYAQYLAVPDARSKYAMDLQVLRADLRSMSALAEVVFDEETTGAAIEAYSDQFMSAPVAMRVTTKPKEKRDLSVRYLDIKKKQDSDPLAIAIARGLTQNDGHQVFAMFAEAKERCGGFGFGVDVDVQRGFSKIWMAPSVDAARLTDVASLVHLPQGARNTLSHFARFGLSSLGLFGFDFIHKTTNLYFMIKNPKVPRDYGALLADLGIRPDRPEVLQVCLPAHVVYYSFSWESQRAERVCFAIVCEDKRQVPVHLHPLFGKCLGDSVFMHGQPTCIYSVVWTLGGHYFKVDNDYSGTQAAQLVEAGAVGV